MAGLAEQLKAVKLHKADEPMKDFSSPKTAGFISDQEVKKKKEKSFHYNLYCMCNKLQLSIRCSSASSTFIVVLNIYA